VEITISPATTSEFSLFLRAPGWSRSTEFTVNGQRDTGTVEPGRYFEIRRQWRAGDRVEVKFDMTPQLIRANPLVREDSGRVAIQRGPLVYCMESADQPALGSLFDAELAEPSSPFREEFRPGLMGGITLLRHKGQVAEEPLEDEPLYEAAAKVGLAYEPADLVFIPYYAWANRGQGAMEVWIPVSQAGSGVR
jgi:DUF1680 family protein